MRHVAWRNIAEELFKLLHPRDIGLVITVDEINADSRTSADVLWWIGWRTLIT